MPCKDKWNQVETIDKAMSLLRGAGFSMEIPAMRELYRLRGQVIGKILGPFPRLRGIVRLITGLSPGELTVWFDIESGFFTEARTRPGDPPVYRPISDDQAVALLRPTPDRELAHSLYEPLEYLGE